MTAGRIDDRTNRSERLIPGCLELTQCPKRFVVESN